MIYGQNNHAEEQIINNGVVRTRTHIDQYQWDKPFNFSDHCVNVSTKTCHWHWNQLIWIYIYIYWLIFKKSPQESASTCHLSLPVSFLSSHDFLFKILKKCNPMVIQSILLHWNKERNIWKKTKQTLQSSHPQWISYPNGHPRELDLLQPAFFHHFLRPAPNRSRTSDLTLSCEHIPGKEWSSPG